MRSSWNGALKCGLLVMTVKLYKATEVNDYDLHQIHKADGGRLKYRRFCELDGMEIPYEDVGKGKEIGDRMIQLTEEDLDKLTGFATKVVDIALFIHAGEVDVTGFGDAYYIEPDKVGLHAYTLLRQQIKASGRVGVATFAMREKSRDSLAIVRAYKDVLILQRMAWPEEIREPAFPVLDQDVTVTDSERELARQLIDALSAPWRPEEHRSRYGEAFKELIKAKIEGSPPPEPPTPAQQAAVQDIGEVLKASVAAAKKEKKEDDAA